MKIRNVKNIVFIILLCISCIFLVTSVSAHSGRTDSSGGHHDYSNASGLGSYHYHHGYPAHLHVNGVCPYDFDDKTGSSSGNSSSTHSSSNANINVSDYNSYNAISPSVKPSLPSTIETTRLSFWGILGTTAFTSPWLIFLFAEFIWTPITDKLIKKKYDTNEYKSLKAFWWYIAWAIGVVGYSLCLGYIQWAYDNWFGFTCLFLIGYCLIWFMVNKLAFAKTNKKLRYMRDLERKRQREEAEKEIQRIKDMLSVSTLEDAANVPPNYRFDINGLPIDITTQSQARYGNLTVYVTRTGTKFHNKSRCSSAYIEIHLFNAIKRGFSPCSICARSSEAIPQWYNEYMRLREIAKKYNLTYSER